VNNEQRDELLIAIRTDTKVTAERVESQGKTLESLAKDVWGNGEKGMQEDLIEVKIQQRDCPVRKANSVENKRLKISHIMIIIAVISIFASVVLGAINLMK